MYQQINLYQPVFRQEARIFSCRTLLVIWGLVILLLVGLYVSQRFSLSQTEASTLLVSSQHERLNQQIVTLMADVDSSESERIETEIQQLQLTRDGIALLLAKMRGSAMPVASRFSALLECFAEQHLAGVWLTGIDISGDTIRLSGQATSKRLVPRYLQRLNQHEALYGNPFTQVQLNVDEKTSLTQFVLQTGGETL